MIPIQHALRRRMMMNASKGLPISSLPLGTLIRVADSDGGDGVANYEIADINNFVSGGVVLVRKNVYSNSTLGSTTNYLNGTLDNLIKTTIYNEMPQKLRDKMMDVSFNLYGSGDITRKMFAPTYTMAGFGNNGGVAEGKALQLYTSDASRVKTFNDAAAGWWLSSQRSSDRAWCVYADGSANYGNPSFTYGVVPAFAIPQSVMLEDSTNEDGSYNIMMEAEGGSAPISELPLGTLINVSTDGGADLPYYEIADKDNLVSGGVVLVRKNIYSTSEFGTTGLYPNSTLDNLITATIYNKIPQKLRDKMMDVSFELAEFGNITRKMFVPTKTMAGFGPNHSTGENYEEGKMLQLYGSTANTRKTFNGILSEWWLSSGYKQYFSSTEFEWAWRTSSDVSEDYHEIERPSKIFGVVPAFAIPSDTPYDPTPNTDGSYNLIL